MCDSSLLYLCARSLFHHDGRWREGYKHWTCNCESLQRDKVRLWPFTHALETSMFTVSITDSSAPLSDDKLLRRATYWHQHGLPVFDLLADPVTLIISPLHTQTHTYLVLKKTVAHPLPTASKLVWVCFFSVYSMHIHRYRNIAIQEKHIAFFKLLNVDMCHLRLPC